MTKSRLALIAAAVVMLACVACDDPVAPNCEDVKRPLVWYGPDGEPTDTTWIITEPCQ